MNRGRLTRSGGRGRFRSRGKSTRGIESDQHHDCSAKVGGIVTSAAQFSSDSNFGSSHSQDKRRGGWSRGQGRGRLKPTAHAKPHNTVGELCQYI